MWGKSLGLDKAWGPKQAASSLMLERLLPSRRPQARRDLSARRYGPDDDLIHVALVSRRQQRTLAAGAREPSAPRPHMSGLAARLVSDTEIVSGHVRQGAGSGLAEAWLRRASRGRAHAESRKCEAYRGSSISHVLRPDFPAAQGFQLWMALPPERSRLVRRYWPCRQRGRQSPELRRAGCRACARGSPL
jgi:hypothetical protein